MSITYGPKLMMSKICDPIMNIINSMSHNINLWLSKQL